MAKPEHSPDIPEQRDVQRDTLNYFLEQQAQDPNFLSNLSERLWGEWQKLSPAEQDTRTAVWAVIHPTDIEAREQSIKGHLLSDYIQSEMDMAVALNEDFRLSGELNPPPSNAA
jgi:hypothetical protein